MARRKGLGAGSPVDKARPRHGACHGITAQAWTHGTARREHQGRLGQICDDRRTQQRRQWRMRTPPRQDTMGLAARGRPHSAPHRREDGGRDYTPAVAHDRGAVRCRTGYLPQHRDRQRRRPQADETEAGAGGAGAHAATPVAVAHRPRPVAKPIRRGTLLWRPAVERRTLCRHAPHHADARPRRAAVGDGQHHAPPVGRADPRPL